MFVGRMEMVPPATRAAVETALVARDAGSLRPYGRFVLPMSGRILADQAVPLDRTATQRWIYSSLAAATSSPACQ